MTDVNRVVGRVADVDMSVVVIGAHRGDVTITAPGWAAGGVRLDELGRESFARLFAAACYEAGRQSAAGETDD